jgi:hypothetical protein
MLAPVHLLKWLSLLRVILEGGAKRLAHTGHAPIRGLRSRTILTGPSATSCLSSVSSIATACVNSESSATPVKRAASACPN